MTLVECVKLVYGFCANSTAAKCVWCENIRGDFLFTFVFMFYTVFWVSGASFLPSATLKSRRLKTITITTPARQRRRLGNVFSSHLNILLSPAWAVFMCLGYPQGNNRKYTVVGQCSAKVSESFLEFAIVECRATRKFCHTRLSIPIKTRKSPPCWTLVADHHIYCLKTIAGCLCARKAKWKWEQSLIKSHSTSTIYVISIQSADIAQL